MTPERLARLKESLDDPNLASFEPWVVRELVDEIGARKLDAESEMNAKEKRQRKG